MNHPESCLSERSDGERLRANAFPSDSVALPPVWAFDEQVPPELSARWGAADQESVLLADFVRTLMNAGAAVLLMIGVASLVTGFGEGGTSVAAMALALGVLMLVRRSHRRSRGRADSFTAGEIDLVLAHRTEISFTDWDLLSGTDAPPEVAVARRAGVLAQQLAATDAWSSEHLATHRLRLDPREEARAIQVTARELFDRRAALSVGSDAGLLPELVAARAGWEQQLEILWSALGDRLEAFEAYTQELLRLAEVIEQSDQARRLHTSLSAQGPALAVRSVRHEMAAADLTGLRAELDLLRKELRLPDTGR
ncbi:hypothetical protein ABIB25_000292 [Nakamurella sp. UYEF19]|uniref:hypothetical protein n=1 Tax=Nakamurella sp. UYEF19 TaxID=1756392 RepID=UPI00339A9AE4